jgi:hypothetical protein
MSENQALISTLKWQPWVFVGLFVVFLAVARLMRLSREIKGNGE